MTKPCAIVEGTIEGTCGKKRDKSGRWVVLKPCGKDDLRYDCWRDKCKTQTETNADNTAAVLNAKSAAKAEAGGVEQERAGEGARQMF